MRTSYNKHMDSLDLNVRPWDDYELIDSGDNRKLERFGACTLIRPETQALWKPSHPELWKSAMAEFAWRAGSGSSKNGSEHAGGWQIKKMPESWDISWEDIHMTLRLTSFKHTGIFPEQAANWSWIAERIIALPGARVLNLFGYTGIASLVAAKHGALVTHVDASKQSNAWAKENAHLSELPSDAIRFITDDALKFTEREVRRGSLYDGIILDPPAFGRGAKGEVWHIEEKLPRLLETLAPLLAKKPGAFFLLNGYAAGYAPQSFLQAVESYFPEIVGATPKTRGEFGELRIKESKSDRAIAAGIYVRFVR